MPADFPPYYIGLMSGTSLDGVNGVLASFAEDKGKTSVDIVTTVQVAFPAVLREEMMGLQQSGLDEIHREAMAANALARLYAQTCLLLLSKTDLSARDVCAIGAHGQTIRHMPSLDYTRQTNNPSLIAELTGMNVIADFRSRDIAAGGQGAPLVPAFHKAVFGSSKQHRAVVNIGGIANVSVLPAGNADNYFGFDTGPGNVLLDGWIQRQQGKPYDKDGAWAASGHVNLPLLEELRKESFLQLLPPKSTGRDLFNMDWLDARLNGVWIPAEDIQATLSMFTASCIVDAIEYHAPDTKGVYICGGGAHNLQLMRDIQHYLDDNLFELQAVTTEELGIPPDDVEAVAFAWLARQFMLRRAGNQPTATGASGPRQLGAFYPA